LEDHRFVNQNADRYACASKHAEYATRILARWKASFQLAGLACQGMKWSGESMLLAPGSRAGRLVSAWVSASSEGVAVIANSVEMAISLTAANRKYRTFLHYSAMPRCLSLI